MSQLNVDRVVDTSGGVLAPISSVMRNRIINGAMVIDQRNAGASVTVAAGGSGFPVDRFYIENFQSGTITAQRSTTAPAGFINSIIHTVTVTDTPAAGDYLFESTSIEGLNMADLGWGTASAKTVTLSFWVRSSVTGTYGIGLRNSAGNRSYVATYTINSANTFEYKTITIAGDTTGTWLTDNGLGVRIFWDLGSGSNFNGTADSWNAGSFWRASGCVNLIGNSGATFYITGVQLEVGTQATSFEYRQYGQELALCQRYYIKAKSDSTAYAFGPANMVSTVAARGIMQFPVVMRTSPTSLDQSGTAADYSILHTTNVTVCNSVPTFSSATLECGVVNFGVASGLTAGQAGFIRGATTSGFLGFSAEL
jgi:hypothetical protein